MEARPLGSTGLTVSPLCLGTMNLGGPAGRWESARIVRRALELGIDFFDSAPTYNQGRSEALLGKLLRGRRDVVIATKVFLPEGAVAASQVRARVQSACEASLRRLRRECIDLYQLHRPVPSLPQEELLRAFDDLARAGKIRFAGCSTHPASMLAEALEISAREGWIGYASEQPPYNLLDRRIEREVVPLCQRKGLAILPWSPLGGGVLAGRYRRGARPRGSRAARVPRFRERVQERAVAVGEALDRHARERGLSGAQLALLWVLHQPGVTAPIIGPRRVAHLEAAAAALEHRLEDADRELADRLVAPGTALVEYS